MIDEGAEREAVGGKPVETKRARFLRIAAKRTQHVLNRLRILGNCSNRGVYEFTPEEVERIFRAIQDELDATRRKFDDRKKARDEFKL